MRLCETKRNMCKREREREKEQKRKFQRIEKNKFEVQMCIFSKK